MRYSKIFFRFLKIMGRALPLFLFAMIIHMVGDNFLYLTLSYFVNKLMDMAQIGSMEGINELLITCIAANVIALAIFFVFGALYDIYAKRGNAVVQRMMIEKLLKLPMDYFDKHHTGEIVSKLMNDADTASQIFTSRLRRVTTPLMSVIVYIIPMIIMCPALAVCMVIINIVSLIINNRYIPKMKKAAKETSISKSKLVQKFMDTVNGRDYIRIYPGARLLLDQYNEENEEQMQGDLEFSPGKIELRNVSFGYGGKEVINNVSAEFEKNKSTAIIGQTGCGKSTLIKLLIRLYPVLEKKIYIGGRDINSIDIKLLRDNIAYVPQETYFFQDTIRENIRLGNLKSTDADVEEAAKLANAHDFILGLPDGYDTVVQDGGNNLSGGERQRIALARAFVKNAPILLMDEATSALDNNNETEIQAAIKKLINGKTALVVAHRDITIDFCDEKYQLS